MFKYGLYVGRFQPFHKGHLDAIDQMIDNGVDNIIMGIGSMQEKGTEKNPFSWDERVEMIKRGVEGKDAKFVYFPIPDFNNKELWTKYIQKNTPVTFSEIYSDNDWTLDCFNDIYGIKSIRLEQRLDICATDIRYEMSSQDESWREKVPKGVEQYLDKIDGAQKVRDILSSNMKERIALDTIVEYENGIVFIERKNPPYGLALPGGLKDNFETVEQGAARELKEETNLDIVDMKMLGVYSKPGRDPRGPVTSITFYGKGVGELKAKDDAKDVYVVPFEDLGKYNLAFDHGEMIDDYMKIKYGNKQVREIALAR